MASLPLELHQVLEEEYVSMYGPLERAPALYDDEEILDPVWARAVLYECGIDVDSTKAAVAGRLNKIVQGEGEDELKALAQSRALTKRGRHFIDYYTDYSKHAQDAGGRQAVDELRRSIVDDALSGAVKKLSDTRLTKIYDALHDRARAGKPRTALCISGGGIRSATFALGVIQGLAAAGKLDRFDLLSTVSGGGYIGSWLSSWMRRHPRGASGVQNDLVQGDTAIGSTSGEMVLATPVPKKRPEHKIDPEAQPVKHLRAYSNYLSPRLGLFSGDTWTMASLYIRNLMLNLLVLVPVLAFLLAFPRFFSAILEYSKGLDERAFHPTGWAMLVAVFTAIGFGYLGYKRPVAQGERSQKKMFAVTSDGHFVAFCVLPLVLAATCLAVFYARANQHDGLVRDPRTAKAALYTVLAMTALPFALYYGRFLVTVQAERRSSGAETFVWKIFFELVAVVAALGTMGALLLLLAKKVFDDPLRRVPLAETLEPLLRTGAATSPQAQIFACFIVPLLLLVFFVQASIFVGLSSLFNEDADREWWGRAGAWLLLSAVFLGVFNAIAVFGPIAFYYAPTLLASIGGGAGLAAALLGFSDKTPANQKQKEEGGATAKAGNVASALTVPVFIVALLAAVSLGTTWLIQQIDDVYLGKQPGYIQIEKHEENALYKAQYTEKRPARSPSGRIVEAKLETAAAPVADLAALRALRHLQTIQATNLPESLAIVALMIVAVVLSRLIGVNKFSMHALYRNRLIRAYLGASRYSRDPDRFTGFDENDNLQMHQLRPELLWAWSFKNVKGFVDALKAEVNPRHPFLAYLWNPDKTPLQNSTRKKLQGDLKNIDGVTLDALVSDLNVMLLERDLQKDGFAIPAWAGTHDTKQIGYSRAMRNRAIFDAQLADAQEKLTNADRPWIKPMAPPVDVEKAPRPDFNRPPMHIVNTALNITSGENLAWQQRMAESFTISPYHSGSLFLGYRSSQEYGGSDGISLGTSVTISGAAASPNMGYHSAPTMAFLLTFFNIRLGAWLGNPGPHGRKTYGEGHPKLGILQFFSELTGNSNDTSKWVYLSDGGHFENLGLYEMVLRRSHTIVVSDAGADPTFNFEDLGNAIRKIRTDLGVPIEIDRTAPAPRGKNGEPVPGRYIAIGRIRYSAVDENAVDGTLIYIKPGIFVDPDVPVDVYNYAQTSRDFPHESTGDQFFSESQFESYRALGRHAFDQLFGNASAAAAAKLPIARKQLDGLFPPPPPQPKPIAPPPPKG